MISDDDIKRVEFILLNEYILRKFRKMSKDSGFTDKHIDSTQGQDRLIKDRFRGSIKQLPLGFILEDYLVYVMQRAEPNNEYHNKVRHILDNTEIEIKKYLQDTFQLNADLQVFCVLALSIIYFFLAQNVIHFLIEKL